MDRERRKLGGVCGPRGHLLTEKNVRIDRSGYACCKDCDKIHNDAARIDPAIKFIYGRKCGRCGDEIPPEAHALTKLCLPCKPLNKKEVMVKWLVEHPNHNQEYHQKNREQILARKKQYWLDDRDKMRLQRREAQATFRKKYPLVARYYSSRRKALVRELKIGKFTQWALTQRLSMFGFKCWICKGAYEEIDHVKPISKGGAHTLSNLRPVCKKCNSRKRAHWSSPAEILRDPFGDGYG